MYIKTLTVGKLNNYIKKIMDNDFILRNIYVKGEISNFKLHSSGHAYFSLKDSEGKINCIMFKEDVNNLEFEPENGMEVIVTGRVSTYIKEGNYQLYCTKIKIEGLGNLHKAFEQLKKSLYEQGFFKEEHKKPLPKYPKKIGVITSPTGAAIRDIINVSKRRNPKIELLIYPTLVQGESASYKIIEGLNYLDHIDDVDAIIIARGGGSLEELWAFNHEELAKAIYKCKKPVVTGVGHETDFTIVDFVSDRRAPTPSAAAEILVPKLEDLNAEINQLKNLISGYMENFIEKAYNKVDILKNNLKVNSPLNNIINGYRVLDNYKNTLENTMDSMISIQKDKIERYRLILEGNNPLNYLNKGFSIVYDEDNNVIRTLENIKNKEMINIRLKDGQVKLRIEVLEEHNG